MRRPRILILAVVLVVCVTCGAQAQWAHPRISVEPRLSYWQPEDSENVFGYGVAVELMLSDWFGLAFAADFWNFEGETFSATLDAFPDWDIRDLSAGAVFYLAYQQPESDVYVAISPYVTVGLDYFVIEDAYKGTAANVFATASADDTVGWHIGVGVDITVSRNFWVVIEGRYFDTSIDIDADVPELPIGEVNVAGFAVLVGIQIGL